MARRYLYPLESVPSDHAIGAKAKQIQWLADHDCLVPKTFVLPFEAETAYRKDPKGFKHHLLSELEPALDRTKRYAVRSSANVEDRADYSFAGQFTSVLDLRGNSAVADGVIELYELLASSPPEAYLKQIGARQAPLQMGVIIQEMVDARVSGVSFSKNPVTGLAEVIVEAIEGSGVELLQGGKTPDRWVAKWGEWTQKPASTNIDQNIIEAVVTQTKAIDAAFGAPVDLEWVFEGENLYWVQVRRITTAENINIYSNRIAREVLPGVIKPLVWSVNTPLVNRAWVDLFTELIGPNDIKPADLARPFYYRAYFNMGVIGQIFDLLGFPSESLELLLGLEGGTDRPTFKPTRKTFRHLPRMLRFVVDKLRFERTVERELPYLRAEFSRFAEIDLDSLQPDDLLDEIEALTRLTQEAAYFNIVIPLLMSIYNTLLKRQLDGLGVDYARFDLTYGLVEMANYDPNVHLADLHHAYQNLSASTQERAASTHPESWGKDPALSDFYMAFEGFLEKFGHLSDSGNDFSTRPWRDDPALVLKMVSTFTPLNRPGERVTFEDLNQAAHQKLLGQAVYRRARQFRYYREAVSSLYTYGYGLFRQYFLALGKLLNEMALFDDQEDIFYLTLDEVKELVQEGGERDNIALMISNRKLEVAAAGEILLPDLIYGDAPPPPISRRDSLPGLSGIPSSRGYFRGPVTVVKRVQDIDRLDPGDVLVIPYSDVSWTPLFGKAGAVIAESGGLLSHSSIVAREFNIPCVVSVSGACQLPDKVEVAVDGYTGTITIFDPEA